MEKHHVKQMTQTKLKEVHENYFIVEKENQEIKVPFDYGFVCLGMKAYNPLYLQLKDYYQDKNGDVLEIGDCKRARRIIEGTQEGRNSIHEGFLLSQAVSIGNAVSALKDTVPGDFSAMNLSEICELIQEHKSNGPVMEMKR